MLKPPKVKSVTVDGKTVRYTMPTSGRIEAERPASFGPPGFVFSEFIECNAGYEIARKESKTFRINGATGDYGTIS
jgi:hypothetical protein